MLVLLTKVLFANTSCPLQKTTQSHFSIELPASEEGSRIRGACSHHDNPIPQPVYADCENGSWQNIDTRYCHFFEAQAISCESMGINKTIFWKNRFLYTTESGEEINFEPKTSPSKEQQRVIRKFARKNNVSLEEGLQEWSLEKEMSILLQERLACVLSTRPSRNTLPKYLQDEECLFKNPSKAQCRGYSDNTYAQSQRYHPTYLVDWKELERNSGSGFPQNISSHWEMRPDKYGKWKYAQLYKYNPSQNWSPQSKLLRESTATLQRRFESDSQTNSLVITSNRNCREVSKQRKKEIAKGLKIVCLPDSMKVYTLGSGWYDSNHNRSIFAITGFDNVEIRDLNIEVRPHPDLNLLLDGDLCHSQNMQREKKGKCEELYQNLFTKYLFPDNYRDVFYHTLRSQNTESTICKDATNNNIDIPYFSDIPDWWNEFSSQCTTPYTTIYEQLSQNFDLHKYMRMTGNIFFIVDNKNVSIANINTKGFTAESHFSLQSNDFVEIDGISSQGISAQELIDQGVPILDSQRGFAHANQENFNPKTTYYMGNGIDIFNGRNLKKITTGYGANCCIDHNNKNQCSEINDYNGPSDSIYTYTNIGPSVLETILQTDFEYRSRCNRNNSTCSKDQDCSSKETCIANRCIQKCSEHSECGSASYCVKGICRDESCDTDYMSISNSSVFNCTQADLRTIDKKGRKENIDGVTVASTSGLIFNNHLYNFQCDSLSDLAQRRPCARNERELHQWLRVERNDYENGVLKTEGTSEPENGILYANNNFKNVRLVDYHRKWRAYYLQNNWFYDENYRQKSAFNQANQEPLTEWHKPYYGSLVFIGNQVHSKSKTHLWNEYPSSIVTPSTKIYSQFNLYIGSFNSFYTKKAGSFSLLKPSTTLPLEHYRFLTSQRYPWTLENDIINSPAILIKVKEITPCVNPSQSSPMDSKDRYMDTYGCLFGESTSMWYSSMPAKIPQMDKISVDENIFVHQYYDGTYRPIKTDVGTSESD